MNDMLLNKEYLASLITKHLSENDTAIIGNFLLKIDRQDEKILSIYKTTRPAFEKRLTRITIGKVLKRDSYIYDKQRENDLLEFLYAV